jgi:heme/copper-type cytochrome/quinol oxidase subunit 2
MARAVATLGMAAFAEAAVHACPICFQIEDAHVTSGIRAAVGVLMGVTLAVMTPVVVFAVRFTRRQTVQGSKGPTVQRSGPEGPKVPEPGRTGTT